MKKVALIASAVDLGSTSISNSLINALRPEKVVFIEQSAKSLGWAGLLKLRDEFGTLSKDEWVVFCSLHVPVLIGALLPRKKNIRFIGLNDWTPGMWFANKPYHPRTFFYNLTYSLLIGRFSRFYSHAERFRRFYRAWGKRVDPFLLPLPYEFENVDLPPSLLNSLLFVGADYRRKGGDLLLDAWKTSAVPDASLTFVCPQPPEDKVAGVTFLTQIKAATAEHRNLFRSHGVFILASHREAYGFAALEAINFGMCVVVTKGCGVSDVVAESGGLVEENSEAAVQAAIRLLSRPDEIADRRRRCANFVSKYSKAVSVQFQTIHS